MHNDQILSLILSSLSLSFISPNQEPWIKPGEPYLVIIHDSLDVIIIHPKANIGKR